MKGSRAGPHLWDCLPEPFSPGSYYEPGLKVQYEPGRKPPEPHATCKPLEPGQMPTLVPVRVAAGTNAPMRPGQKPFFY